MVHGLLSVATSRSLSGRRQRLRRTVRQAVSALLGVAVLAGGDLASAQAPPDRAQESSEGDSLAGDQSPAGAPASPPRFSSAGPRSPFEYGPVLRSYQLRGVRPDVVGRILAGEEGGRLPVEALALPFGSGVEERSRVALFVEIDGAGFLNNNQATVARVEVYVYALSGTSVAGHLAEVFAVDVAELGETVWQSGLKLYGGLSLPPGAYELHILVRNAGSGAEGLRRLELEVPGTSGSPAVAPLTFAGPLERDSWLPIRSRSLDFDEGRDYAFRFRGRAVSPAARAVLVTGREQRAIQFHRDGIDEPAAPRVAAVEFMSESETIGGTAPRVGEVIATAEATVLEAVGEVGGILANEITFVPPDLPPGLYRVRFSEGGTSGSRSAWTPVAVIDAETQERDLLWSDLRWLLSSGPTSQPREMAAGPAGEAETRSRRERKGRAVRRMARRYTEVLELLGPESGGRAITALFEMESEVLGRGDRKAALRLREAELAVATELGKHGAANLLPLLRLHSEVGEQYLGRRVFSLVAHARTMVELFAELHAELGGPVALTAKALASQGGYRQQANLLSSSRRLFVRALEHDPGSASALLGLAASFEKYAEYNLAIEQLQLFLGRLPDSDEARLRLAINQARVGWVQRARQGLEVVVGRAGGDWEWELAVEELARINLLAGNVAEARKILESAREQSPGAAGIRFLLGHVYDRQNRVDGSLALVSGIETDRSGLPSARRRYDEWPERLLEEDRRVLRSAAEAVMPAWTSVLEKMSG